MIKGYDLDKLTIGVLGGHSALDVCHGAKTRFQNFGGLPEGA